MAIILSHSQNSAQLNGLCKLVPPSGYVVQSLSLSFRCGGTSCIEIHGYLLTYFTLLDMRHFQNLGNRHRRGANVTT